MKSSNQLAAAIDATVRISIAMEDVDDIMSIAFDAGITYWCGKVEVVGDYLGEYASEQISRGGTLKLYDMEADKVYSLTLQDFINGFRLWYENGYDHYGAVADGKVDTCNIGAVDADIIIQYAVFGEVIYA